MADQVTATVVRGETEGLSQTQELALAALRTGSTFRQAAGRRARRDRGGALGRPY